MESGLVHYNTGKPCRRGHIADRFVSNGSCVECLRIAQDARINAAKIAKGRYNLARAAGLREKKFMVAAVNDEIVQQVCDILQHAPRSVIDKLEQEISTLYALVPVPRVLARDDIMVHMKWNGEVVENLQYLDIDWPDRRNDGDDRTYIYLNRVRYAADEVMEVLRGQRLNVRPK